MALPINRGVNEVVVTARMADVAAASTIAWAVAPCKGRLVRAYSVVEGTTNGAPVMTYAIAGGSALSQTLTIASGGGAGDVDSVEFSRGSTTLVAEGDKISITTDGAGSTTVIANHFLVIEKE